MQIILPRDVRSRMVKVLRQARSREIGGFLMGEQLDDRGTFRVVDFTVDTESGERAYFERKPEVHASALQAFFHEHGNDFSRFNYLGEWHSHPSFPVHPSGTDINTMFKLVNGSENIDFAVLVIVRLRMFFLMEAGATLFMRGSPAQAAALVDDHTPKQHAAATRSRFI